MIFKKRIKFMPYFFSKIPVCLFSLMVLFVFVSFSDQTIFILHPNPHSKNITLCLFACATSPFGFALVCELDSTSTE